MNKRQLISVLSEHFKVGDSDIEIGKLLGITRQAVNAWPDTLTKSILHGVAGKLVGRRLPKELIDAIKGAR